MNCILTFKIGDETIEVTHDGSLPIDSINSDLLSLLKKSEQWGDIVSSIQKQMQNKIGSYESVTIKQLTDRKGLIPNSNIQFLQDQFPTVIFPENAQANILFLDNLKLGGKEHFGRYTKADGSELFIVRNNEYDIENLANFLNLREQLKQGFEFSEDSEQFKFLNRAKGNKTINELIEDFITNKSSYENKKVTIDGKEVLVYPKLDKILRDLLEIPTRKQYEDEFTNNVNSLLKYKKAKGKWSVNLNINQLYNIVKTTHPEILPETIKTVKDFKQFFGTKENLSEEEQQKYSNGYEMLLDKLIDTQTFPYIYKKHDGINIILETPSRKISDRFGIGYDTIQTMEIVNNDYNGYKIYAQNVDDTTYYYPSKHYLTESTITNRFTNIEEAQQYIDERNNTQDIYENGYIEFNYDFDSEVLSPKYIEEGTIIEVRNYPIDRSKDVLHSHLFKPGNTRKDFERIINGMNLPVGLQNRIFTKIVTPEDMSLFIYEIDKDTIYDDINQLINQITSKPKKAYYIESRKTKSYKENGKSIKYYVYKVIPTEPNQIEQYKKQKNIPTVTLIKSIAESFKSKFGVNVHYLNKDQMQEQFPEIEEDIKAFIRNGEIYVNTFAAKSSDLLHEYTHLLLGVLKSNPDSRAIYEQLLDMVMDTVEGKREFNKIESSYSEISEMDIREEVFANLFGNYLSGRGSDINNIFKESEKFLKKENQNIFDLTSETDLKTIYNKKLDSIFGRFSSDVASKLKEENGLDFSETINTRKKSDWINKQIKEGNIKEDCSG